MKIESKMSGWAISDFDIKIFPHVFDNIVTLNDIDKLSKRTAQWILDNYNLVGLNSERTGCNFGVVMGYDDLYKASIMESYPELEKELADYFGSTNWTKCYLRFGH